MLLVRDGERDGRGYVMAGWPGRLGRPEVWVPGGYLLLVAAVQVWVEIVSRTVTDGGFAAIWSLLVTAPGSMLALVLAAVPGPDGGVGALLGFYAALVFGASVNAALLWGLVRAVRKLARYLSVGGTVRS
ncbi:SCO4225 family membrane protein [Kitasatospora sp. McL0602]|uniref:SCO4225 family membrane protein n=1 Tax=Kitasatospora sp. McL0602 TaxID=3439530 RepID=UPI003F8C789F